MTRHLRITGHDCSAFASLYIIHPFDLVRQLKLERRGIEIGALADPSNASDAIPSTARNK